LEIHRIFKNNYLNQAESAPGYDPPIVTQGISAVTPNEPVSFMNSINEAKS